jgi:hypothetical protein
LNARSASANVCGRCKLGSRRVRTPTLKIPRRVGRSSPAFGGTISPAGQVAATMMLATPLAIDANVAMTATTSATRAIRSECRR